MAEVLQHLIDQHKEVCDAHEALVSYMETDMHRMSHPRAQSLNAIKLTQLQRNRDRLAALIDKTKEASDGKP